ncbi:MAG: response regulator [Gammaproteobacteria bacterium]|nr:response regulator [Gammaproteobacteria bacterium]
MTQSIAIVEDDLQQRRLYADALRAHDYHVAEYASRESAIEAFELGLPDLAILDIALNADVGGGYEICRYLNERDANLPIIFLTSRGDELDKIYGLQLGAWDYQTKPVSLEFLIVRVASFFRIQHQRNKQNENKKHINNVKQKSAHINLGKLRLSEKSMQCYWQEKEINLTPTEFSLLIAMVKTDEPVSIDALIKSTCQGVVENNTVNTHILHIRKKFKNIDSNFKCIKTRYGFGYQWLCE